MAWITNGEEAVHGYRIRARRIASASSLVAASLLTAALLAAPRPSAPGTPGAGLNVLPEDIPIMTSALAIAGRVSWHFTHGAKSDRYTPTEHWGAGAGAEYLRCGTEYSREFDHDYIAWIGGWEVVDDAAGTISNMARLRQSQLPESDPSEDQRDQILEFVRDRPDSMAKAEVADLCDSELACIYPDRSWLGARRPGSMISEGGDSR